MSWLHSIIELMDRNLSQLQKMVRDREAWRAAVHGVAKSRTGLKRLSMYVFIYLGYMPRSGIAGHKGMPFLTF